MGLLGVFWSCYLWRYFHGSIGEFIGAFSGFLEVQTIMVVEFYGIIHVMGKAQKMELTNV